MLKEKDRFIRDEKELANLINSFLINITGELDLKKDTETFLSTTITLDGVLVKFHYDLSIKRIRETFNNNEKF